MKQIEKATILRLNDNLLTANTSIVSIGLKYEDNSIQTTPGYRGNAYTNFIKNIMTLLNIQEKNEMLGKSLLACTNIDQLLALGNQTGDQWIDLKKINEIITGDILQYFEEKELER